MPDAPDQPDLPASIVPTGRTQRGPALDRVLAGTGGGDVALLAIAVGNSRTRFGHFAGRTLHHPHSADNEPVADLLERLLAARSPEDLAQSHAVIASVNDPVRDAIANGLRGKCAGIWHIGTDVPIEMNHTLDNAETVGQDRLLCAAGVFARAAQACIVIDAGTAVTVDFIDGEGTFHGGVIAPGLRMMLNALHNQTSALPQIEPAEPAVVEADQTPFGKDTPSAMRLGVRSAVKGLVRDRAEAYAEFYGGYPQIIATGGDAIRLFDDDDLVEHIVPDLQLIGIQSAVERALSQDADSSAADDR